MTSSARRVLSFLTAALLFGATAARAEEKIVVTVVKYAGLAEAVKQLRGKVVVVDLWAHW